MVMMTTYTVRMAMSHFFAGGFTDIDHFQIESQSTASQRVVEINSDHELAGLDDSHLTLTLFGVDHRNHTGLYKGGLCCQERHLPRDQQSTSPGNSS